MKRLTTNYNVSDMRFRTHDICIHCGNRCSEEHRGGFLLRQEELPDRNVTDGYPCFLICMICFNSRKKFTKYNGRKPDLMQVQKEKAGKKKAEKPKK